MNCIFICKLRIIMQCLCILSFRTFGIGEKRFFEMGNAVSIKGNVQIFAVGGGGFTHEQTSEDNDFMLEDYLLALSSPSPHIGYIGHASNDDPDRISAFYARFEGVAHTSHLLIEADATAAEAFVADLDILYVGGGSTIKMLSHWREAGIDTVMLAAGRRGMILSGVSAGAICWFEQLLVGTAEDGYILTAGLGLVGGSVCPHYSNEPSRKIAYEAQIMAGNLLPGVAIDDGVGVHIKDGAIADIVRAGAGDAYFVSGCSKGIDSPACDVTALKIGDEISFL